MGKKSKPQAPAAPDYTQLANTQTNAARSAADYQNSASRVNQSNPFGSLTWSQGPGGQWTSTTTLDPQQQALLDSLRSGASQPGVSNVGTTSFQGIDTSNLPSLNQDFTGAAKQAQDANYQQQTAMLDPQFNQQEEQLRARLINSGLAPGSQAYEQAVGDFNRTKQAAYDQARQSSIAAGNAQAANLQQQAVQQYNTLFGANQAIAGVNNANSLNQFSENYQNAALANALRSYDLSSLSSVVPQFGGTVNAAGYTPGNYFQAGQDQYQAALDKYNADVAAKANNPLSFSNLLGAGLTAAGTAFGGPIGGALGSAAGKWAGSIFGGGQKQASDPYAWVG